jgi:RimJ/RimL family protein N-acetyltransferase
LPPITLVPFTRDYLDRSWTWLNDPETKRLTMTPDFTRDDQERFFAGLPRDDYLIWGIALADGTAVGAAGLKNFRATTAEFWGYIGEPQFRGRGLGAAVLEAVEAEAKQRGLRELDLRVAEFNEAATRLYRKSGYAGTGRAGGVLFMAKALDK